MNCLVFEMIRPNGQREVLQVDSERALVGSGAHCEIRVPAEDADFESLFVEARPGAVFAESRSSRGLLTVNQTPFVQGRILPDSVIGLGGFSLRVATVASGASFDSAEGEKRKSNPRLYVLATLLCLASAYVLTHRPHEPAVIGAPPEPLALWSGTLATCPHESNSRALALAEELWLSAEGKRERAPFNPNSGVVAVSQYRQAATCFERGGAPERALAARHSAESLAHGIDAAYRMERLRLERALATSNYEGAARQVKYLKSILGGRVDPYLNWLSAIERVLTVKLAQGKATTK